MEEEFEIWLMKYGFVYDAFKNPLSGEEVEQILNAIEVEEQNPYTSREEFADICFNWGLKLCKGSFFRTSMLLFEQCHDIYKELHDEEMVKKSFKTIVMARELAEMAEEYFDCIYNQ